MKKRRPTLKTYIFWATLSLSLIALTIHLARSSESTQTSAETVHTARASELYTYQCEPAEPFEYELLHSNLNEKEVALLGRAIWGEAEGVHDKAEQAAVAWCILNRVSATGQNIEEVVTSPNQFVGFYRVDGEVPEEFLDLAADVLSRWNLEKQGVEDVGRVLPADYFYFVGDGARNYFSKEWQSTDYWGWTLKSPY